MVKERSDGINAALEKALKETTTVYSDREKQLFAELDEKLEEYKKDAAYRLGRLDEAGAEIEGLEQTLRTSIDNAALRADAEFAKYVQKQQQSQANFVQEMTTQADSVAAKMQTLESSLNELKEKAYDNVSEKLKLFEDDFFRDLAKRSDMIDENITQWKAGFDSRLTNMADEYEQERREVEGKYSETLKERLAAVQSKFHEQSVRLEDLIRGWGK